MRVIDIHQILMLLFENISYTKLKQEVEKFLSMDLRDHFIFKNGKWEDISESKDYKGLRFIADFYFSGSKIRPIQIDFTLSEVKNNFLKRKFKTNIFRGEFSAKIYSPEMIIAEKLQTIIWRGEKNTRARDIYDINFLMRNNIKKLPFKESMNRIFKARNTKIPDSFFKFISKKDTKKLEESWTKYERNLDEYSFDKIWKQFKKNLHTIDSLLNKKH